jgi:hypothetical protein
MSEHEEQAGLFGDALPGTRRREMTAGAPSEPQQDTR